MNKVQPLPHNIAQRLRVLEVLERITQISLASEDMEETLVGVLDLVLEVFNADRTWFLYPCDPDAPSWAVPMERTRPEWPGLFAKGADIPMDSDTAAIFSELLSVNKVIHYSPDNDLSVPSQIAQLFSIKSQLMIALRPKIGKPWVFGLHHCASEVKHNEEALQLFTAIAYRIADTLSDLLSIKQLRESEIRLQEQADIVLQQSERHLKQAQSIAHIGSWDYSLATGQLIWSDELYRIFGVSPETFTPKIESFINLIHPDDQSAMESWIDACAAGQKQKALEFRCIWPDGTIRYVEGQGELIVDDLGKPSCMSGTGQDITKRKQFEVELLAARQAEQANRLKSEFLGRMSHELRTPLNAILGFAQIMELSDDDETLAAHRDNLNTMARSGWHLLRIIQDLLNLSEIEAGKVTLHMEKIDLYACMNDCFELLTPLAKELNIKISSKDGTCKGVTVWADPFRLKQVLTNLLTNAIKYNREGGSIIISGQCVQDRLRILISDTGMGIPESEFASLFQPFSRVVERPYSIEGAGIGLSIAKQLTELMAGTIGLESVVGEGSTFWIELPLAKAQPSATPPKHVPVQHNDHTLTAGKQTTLLCIEDNPDHIKLIETIVSGMEKISLLTAMTPSLGLDLARTHRPDMILLDICLPGMNGYEVLKRLQADGDTQHIPVIAVSASAHPVEIEEGLLAGFRCYLTKPLDVVEFKNTVAELLRDNVK